MLRSAIEEIEAVARSKGVELDDDVTAKTMAVVEGLPDDATASMQRDVRDGRLFELEVMTGSLVRYEEEEGVPTPINRYIYATLKPHLLMRQESIRQRWEQSPSIALIIQICWN
jgi:2-dehydropantoate 2-reductase